MSDFAGKSVIVTGGSLGMGLACATRFVQGGADVLIVANDKASIETALASLGPQVRGLVFGSEFDVEALRAWTKDAVKRVAARATEED